MAVVRVRVDEAVLTGAHGRGVGVASGEAEEAGAVAPGDVPVEVGVLLDAAEEKGGGLHRGDIDELAAAGGSPGVECGHDADGGLRAGLVFDE